MAERPSGAETTVSGPLNTTTAPEISAARLACSNLDSALPNSGKIASNSPLCGVRIVGGGPLLNEREQFLRVGLERGQPFGVDDDGRLAGKHGGDVLPRFGRRARAGPDQHGVPARVGEDFGQSASAFIGGNHDRGQLRRIDVKGRFRGGHGDKPRADPQRRARAQPSRAGAFHRAGNHHRVPTVVFMAVGLQSRKIAQPEIGFVDEGLRHDLGENRARNADINRPDVTAIALGGQQDMAGLAAEKGNGGDGLEGDALDRCRMSNRCRSAHRWRRPAIRAHSPVR